jgi:perosamine synthetase
VIRELAAMNIDSRPCFYPLSHIPAYSSTAAAQAARSKNQVAYEISPHGVNLPCGLSITESQVDRVCSAIKEILASRKHQLRHAA